MSAATSLTLYAIEDHLIALFDTLEGLPDDETQMRAELELAIEQALSAEVRKVDGAAHMLDRFEIEAELAARKIKRLQARKKMFERAADRLEGSVRRAMELAGKTTLDGETSSLVLVKNPAAVFVRNFDAVPASYKIVKTDISIDKDAVKRAIKAGIDVPGAELVCGDRLECR